MEYGDGTSARIGDGIFRTLSVINPLEINEQSLCSRVSNLEQRSLFR
ncbi:hypothetical protein [Archangium sp.]|nr:hypothetical protein [Archangium sp.]